MKTFNQFIIENHPELVSILDEHIGKKIIDVAKNFKNTGKALVAGAALVGSAKFHKGEMERQLRNNDQPIVQQNNKKELLPPLPAKSKNKIVGKIVDDKTV